MKMSNSFMSAAPNTRAWEQNEWNTRKSQNKVDERSMLGEKGKEGIKQSLQPNYSSGPPSTEGLNASLPDYLSISQYNALMARI